MKVGNMIIIIVIGTLLGIGLFYMTGCVFVEEDDPLKRMLVGAIPYCVGSAFLIWLETRKD